MCGHVRYALAAEPANVVDCHCRDCQRSSGAPFVTWTTVPRAGFALTRGSLQYVAFADRRRGFAPCCGTPVVFEEDAVTEWIDVTVASFDEPGALRPAKALWLEDHQPWVPLNPQIPGYAQRTVTPGGAAP